MRKYLVHQRMAVRIAVLLAGLGCALVAWADDDAGALARLTAEGVIDAARLVERGKVYSLAITTGVQTPAWAGRSYQLLPDRIFLGDASTYGDNRLQGFDDYACLWLGIGTQIDGFAHVAVNGLHYQDLPSDVVIRPRGAQRYGIEQLRPIVGRGVLLDMTLLQDGEPLAAGTPVNRTQIQAVAARQGVTIEAGDTVLLHTGWLSMATQEPTRFMQTEPGLGLDGARYLVERGVVAIGADNHSLEVFPAERAGDFLPVHGFLLQARGVHVLENLRTEELAADRAYTFLFVLAAPKLEGAVQSPVHPVAIR